MLPFCFQRLCYRFIQIRAHRISVSFQNLLRVPHVPDQLNQSTFCDRSPAMDLPEEGSARIAGNWKRGGGCDNKSYPIACDDHFQTISPFPFPFPHFPFPISLFPVPPFISTRHGRYSYGIRMAIYGARDPFPIPFPPLYNPC